jgi:glycerate 2-kinase
VRVLVAPDKLAGTLSAAEAAEAIAAGWSRAAPDDVITVLPVADGGPGTLAVVRSAVPGATEHEVEVPGPLGSPVRARWVRLGDTALVEVAQACGLHLVRPADRDLLAASSRGVGELLAAVLAVGVNEVVVGVGGTATCDAGRGLLAALAPEAGGGGGPRLVAAVDVDAPLLGPDGAALGFGEQKLGPGQGEAVLAALEAANAAWAREHPDGAATPGAGAGGGIGAALAVLGAQVRPGADVVADLVGLDATVAAADLVVTAEGRFDWQSLRGKAPAGVARRAQAAGLPCVLLAGEIHAGRRELAAVGVDAAYSLVELAGSRSAALAEPSRWLSDAAELAGRTWSGRVGRADG